MIRRRLFAYAVMMTAGVTSGFFVVQKTEIVTGSLFMIACGATACVLLRNEIRSKTDKKDTVHASVKELTALILCMLTGFMLFTLSYISFERDMTDAAPGTLSSGDPAPVTVTGHVSNIKIKDDSIQIEVSDAVIYEKDPETAGEEQEKIFLNHRILASYKGHELDLGNIYEAYGSGIVLRGTVSIPPQADDPGCFDYRTYLRSIDTSLLFRAVSIELTETQDQPREIAGFRREKRRALIKCRELFLDHFEDEQIRGFIRGVVFGDKSEIEESVRNDFNTNNTGHILAVSGLHIGFLYTLLKLLSGKRKSLLLTAVILMLIYVYGEMTLWSASTVRAVLVLAIRLMSVYFRRPFDLLSAVSTAEVMILTTAPYQLFNAGFQMTFMALLGIAFLVRPVSSFTGEYLGVMISVQIGAAPLAAFTFHRFNPLSVLINIPVITVASVLVPVCIITLYLSTASGIFGYIPLQSFFLDLAVKISDAVAYFIVWVNRILAGNGSFSIDLTTINPGVILGFYLIVFTCTSEWFRVRLLRREYNNIIIAIICLTIVSSAAFAAAYNRFADDEVVFVSVGQGDCTHIRSGGKDILIDGGGSPDINTGERVLMPYLLSNGADRVELAMVTHLHVDHYKGIVELSEIYPVARIGIPSDYMKSIENTYSQPQDTDADSLTLPDRDKIMYLRQGTRINISDDVYVDPLWPLPGTREISVLDPNENNMVYMIHYWNIRIMVTGDLLESDEHEMVRYYRGTDTLKCDILKVAHHGSKSSSCDEFLDAADPEVAVIQVGRNNWYGHPHQQTLDRLEDRGIPVYRTDLNGAVGIDIRGDRVRIDAMNCGLMELVVE